MKKIKFFRLFILVVVALYPMQVAESYGSDCGNGFTMENLKFTVSALQQEGRLNDWSYWILCEACEKLDQCAFLEQQNSNLTNENSQLRDRISTQEHTIEGLHREKEQLQDAFSLSLSSRNSVAEEQEALSDELERCKNLIQQYQEQVDYLRERTALLENAVLERDVCIDQQKNELAGYSDLLQQWQQHAAYIGQEKNLLEMTVQERDNRIQELESLLPREAYIQPKGQLRLDMYARK